MTKKKRNTRRKKENRITRYFNSVASPVNHMWLKAVRKGKAKR